MLVLVRVLMGLHECSTSQRILFKVVVRGLAMILRRALPGFCEGLLEIPKTPELSKSHFLNRC